MEVTVGTFNLNNLFSRYNFEAEIDALPVGAFGLLSVIGLIVLTVMPDKNK